MRRLPPRLVARLPPAALARSVGSAFRRAFGRAPQLNARPQAHTFHHAVGRAPLRLAHRDEACARATRRARGAFRRA
eukprot:3701032-Prymnesium_polylepis.1